MPELAKSNKCSSTRLHRFVGERAGNVSILFGMSSLILIGSVGGAIDFANWFRVKHKMQAAMDAAALAGGRAMQVSALNDPTVAISAADQYFQMMKPVVSTGGTPTFSVQENGTVIRGNVTFGTNSPFLSVMGMSSLTGNLVTEAVIAAGGNAGTNLEISLMLDMTGSMSGQKMADLKLAAKDLVDIVVWADQSEYTSKVALAPFSARVNVGSYIDKVSDVHTTRSFSGNQLRGITCVTERIGPEAFTDARPVGQNTLSAYRADTGNAARDNQDNYSANGVCHVPGSNNNAMPEIMPLTADATALKARIDSLPAAGSTAGSLGTAWAWYLISPLWNNVWQGTNRPAPYADLTTLGPKGVPLLKKVVVLMTDGAYNTTGAQNYGDGSGMAQTISDNAVTLCTNMKAAGIKVYTVGFDLGGDAMATNTLNSCASNEPTDPPNQSSYFFNTSTGSELRGAFRQIALQLSTLRIRS